MPKVKGILGGGLAWLLLGGLPVLSQELMELGPVPTREMFPLFLPPLVYQPVNPTPVGQGRWRVSLDHVRANTFEFSEVFKDQVPRDAQGRVAITKAFILSQSAQYAALPLVYYFDEEIVRTTLRVRYGLTDRTDVWMELPFQSHTGGYLDNVIEGFHHLGFEQFGRDRVVRNQLTLVVMTHGQLPFFSDQPIRGKTQDPTLGLVHVLAQEPGWTLSIYGALKPPLTTTYDVYQSGWDQTLGLSARWQPGARHVFYFGAGFLRRPGGSLAYNDSPFGRIRNGVGAHGTWEYRGWSRIRPFFQLYAQSGYLPRQPSQKLDRPSLQHDLGFHWQLRREATLTFRYLNNITHNENTADMGIGLILTASF